MAEKPKLPAGLPEAYYAAYLELLEDWVQFCPALGRLCGSAAAGLMLSKALTWSRTKEVIARGGWFWKTAQEWEEETCLSTREQQTARRVILEKGFWEEKKEKHEGAPTMHFRVNLMRIIEVHIGEVQAKMEKSKTPNHNENGKVENAKSMVLAESPNENTDLAKKEFDKSAKSYKEANTLAFDTAFDTRGDTRQTQPRHLSPNVLLIAQENFWKFFEQSQPDPKRNHDADEMDRLRAACVRAGLRLSQGKEILREHPKYRGWAYLELFDSQQEILFPEPKRPSTSGTHAIAYPAEFRSDPEAWQEITAKLKTKLTPHSYDTWLKPTRGEGVCRGVLYVRIPTPEFRHIGEKFGDDIREFLPEGIKDVKFCTAEDMSKEFPEPKEKQHAS